MRRPSSWAPLACALIAVLVAGLAAGTIMAANGMRASALIRMTNAEPIGRAARAVDPDFVIYPDWQYDGIYMYAVARDPFLLGEEHKKIYLPGARYGHPLFGWLARLFSLGSEARIPLAMLLINLTAIGVASWSASLIASRLGWKPWGGLVVALNPGLIYATAVSTSEVIATMVFLIAVFCWIGGRRLLAAVLMVPLCLAKEPFVLVPVSFAAWEILKVLRGASRERLWSRVGVLAFGPFAFLLWEFYLWSRLGYWAFTDSLEVFALPLVGWFDTLQRAAGFAGSSESSTVQLAFATIPLLSVLFVALVTATVVALRVRSPIDILFVGLAALHLCLTWRNLLYTKDLIRQFSPIFLLMPAVLAFGSRRWPNAPSPQG